MEKTFSPCLNVIEEQTEFYGPRRGLSAIIYIAGKIKGKEEEKTNHKTKRRNQRN
jgi:hypothetical protein